MVQQLGLLALLGVSLLVQQTLAASYCAAINPPVPPCVEPSPRDLLFLVDGSNSMNPDRFYGEMLDYCLSLYCAFDPSRNNQAGLIVFNQQIKTFVPLAAYSQTQWYNNIQTVKNTRNTANAACCSCCTPTAEAFDAATEELALRGINELRIAFMITDGVPSNNNANTGGNPAWWFYNPNQGFNPAHYNMRIVPQRANALKAAGNRLFLVGVPNIDNLPPNQDYFNGAIAQGSNQCVTRQLTTFCDRYEKPPFPIVSLPVDKNSFSSNTWDVQGLISQTVGALCEILPTPAPTRSPTTPRPTTLAPTKQPTASPTTIPPIEQVDVTFLIDRSRSMLWHNKVCKSIVESIPGEPETPPTSYCWELFTEYVLAQADELAQVPAGENKDRALGWADDFPGAQNPAKGLRVNLLGFACANKQRTPRVFPFSLDMNGGPITSRAKLVEILETLRTTVTPDGGTCPGLAIEQAVSYIEATKAEDYPLQTVILITDGVFYDMPFPSRAVQGLSAYKALRFAVGIAVAKGSSSNYGLTPEEIKTQRQQLNIFVGGNEALFKNLDTEGWSALPAIAEQIADDLPSYFFQGKPIPRYTWCGWRRKQFCQAENWRKKNCKWQPKKAKQWACSKRKK